MKSSFIKKQSLPQATQKSQPKHQTAPRRGLTLAHVILLTCTAFMLMGMSSPIRPINVSQLANISTFEYEGMVFEGDSNPAGFAWFRNELVFSATDVFGDTELYSYDGQQVQLLANINEKVQDYMPQSSSPSGFVAFGNELVFSADDGVTGRELWSYDGHQVRLLADINQTVRNGANQSSYPSSFVVFGNELVFRADDGETGSELWSYNGHTVRRVANINPIVKEECIIVDPRRGTKVCTQVPQSSVPGSLTVFGNELIFRANDGFTGEELWSYNGVEVRQVANINQVVVNGLDKGSGVGGFVVSGNELVFAASDGFSGYELWGYDGDAVYQIADIKAGPGGAFGVSGFVGKVFGNEVVFSANDGINGEELWAYAGRTLRMVADINPSGSSIPSSLTVFGGEMVFAAEDGVTGRELWSYDGFTVHQIADINPAVNANCTIDPRTGLPNCFIVPQSSYPMRFAVFGNELVFAANDGTTGVELWSYDGHLASQLADINPVPGGSANPAGLMVFGNELIFSANDGTTGTELWRLSH